MCVGIPRKIVEISNPETNLAMIEVNGKKHEINIAFLVDADHPVESCVGEWALINLGFAMSRIDETEAHKTLELLRELGEAQMQMDAMLRNNKD
jgi:hydrogenase expression/formation protein HypC